MQPFLRKIFEAISSLTLIQKDGKTVITEMHSPEGETVQFVKPVIPSGGLVEQWLTALEQ